MREGGHRARGKSRRIQDQQVSQRREHPRPLPSPPPSKGRAFFNKLAAQTCLNLPGAIFPRQIPRALARAAPFAKGAPVAHSLGTRLALELIRHVGAEPRVEITRLVFFAAAVPTFMLEDARERHGLRLAYDRAVKGGLLSLYSGSDMVLSVAFPAGQSLAPGPEGIVPTPLGLALWASPQAPATLQQQQNCNAGHSDYWGWRQRKRKCEVFANLQARDFLGLNALGDRQLADAEAAAREVPQAPPTATRDTPSRKV